MKCPVCNDENLVMADRQGIEIDYCPQCRGVWLDRGELDKIIERSSASTPPQPSRGYREPRHDHRESSGYGDSDDYYRKKRKKSLLGEIFDF